MLKVAQALPNVKDTAPVVIKPLRYEDDGELLFSAPQSSQDGQGDAIQPLSEAEYMLSILASLRLSTQPGGHSDDDAYDALRDNDSIGQEECGGGF